MEMRDKQLSILLAQEAIDNEDIWTNYEQEETQMKVIITDAVVNQLVVECAKFLFK